MLTAWSVKTTVVYFIALIIWRTRRITEIKPAISNSIGQYLISVSLNIRLKKNGFDILNVSGFLDSNTQISNGKLLFRNRDV